MDVVRGIGRLAAAGAFFLAVLAAGWAQSGPQQGLRPVKLMVISMFRFEAEPWIKNLNLIEEVPIAGLSADYPNVRCNADGVCQMTTGMGHANAAASTMALILSQRFDLRKAYILIAGIAGINPELGSIGSATWARYLVDFGLQHEIDPREMPKDWQNGFLGLQTSNPGQKPKFNYGTELFQVDEILLDKIMRLTAGAKLADSDAARAYRAHYPAAPANQPPAIIQCDTLADDTYWHGGLIGQRASAWTLLVTDGKGTYCTTEQEDNATFEALRRGQAAGLLDLKRVAVLRTASNFDRPYPGQSVAESLAAKSGGFPISIANLYLAAAPWVTDLVSHWEQWQDGVPQ